MKIFGRSKQDENKRKSRVYGNNLGVISLDIEEVQVYRSKSLDLLDKYYENKQYDHLSSWEKKDVPLHKKQPKIKYPFARNLSSRVVSKLIGQSVFPEISIKDDETDNEFIKSVISTSKIKSQLLEPFRRLVNTGSIFIRFKLNEGNIEIKHYDAKYCYPTFQSNGELESLVYKYVYDDEDDRDSQGRPKKKWYKLEFNTESEILFDNPEYSPYEKSEPVFNEVERVDHGFGFVQGQWFKTSTDGIDGYGLIQDLTEFIDELCYSISQSSRSVSYNQDPQLIFKGVDEDLISNLIRSITKSWNLGRDGEAKFLESEMKGVEAAQNLRDVVKNSISDLARVTLLDPEKIVGSAQSAKAMEVLHGAFNDLINELRSVVEDQLKSFITKIAAACLLAESNGFISPIQIPKGYTPKSLDITFDWPPIFPLTIEDWQKIVNISLQAANANIISRKTATKKVKDFFGIVDIDAEHNDIAAQPVFNPFGSF